MAKKSEIREAAKGALAAFAAAADTPDEAQAAAHIREGLNRLSEAAGFIPKGTKLRETETADPGELSLAERLGIGEDGHRLRERMADTEQRGLLNTVMGETDAEVLRECFR